MAEKEYIEREAVLAYMAEVKAACISNFEYEASAVIAGMIGEIKDDEIPTADVVEVVRCKDCIHYSSNKPKSQLHRSGYCLLNEEVTDDKREPNDFCSYGERNELDTAAEIISQYAGMPLHQLVDIMAEVPSEDVAPVRHGAWANEETAVTCTACGRSYDTDFEIKRNVILNFDYCPNCGAKMDGKEKI